MVITCRCEKPHVRREWAFGEQTWCAARPGTPYLVGHGLHFYTWQDAIEYATEETP
ncbi:hypothetical protein FB385_2667 [Paramicrobacterium agarici]|nr:hypothetical protein FB385_2667 [Microbacterium agarici]